MFIADNGGFHSSGAVTKFAAITVEVCFVFFSRNVFIINNKHSSYRCRLFFCAVGIFSPFDRNLQRHVDKIQL